jgi:hypothetical protein
MDWDSIARFFSLESVATYIVALGTAAYWVYKWWRSKQGRHVVCTQSQPVFTHLSMTEQAREWVKVQFARDDQHCPVQVEELSQVVIEIKNDSDTDALNDVKLKFRLPDARVLRVSWEEPPDYIREEAQLLFSPEDVVSAQPEETIDPTWQVEVSLPDLKSFKKYGESCAIGILADGDLRSIEMVPQGSKPHVAPEQVWTAKFVSYDDFLKQGARYVTLRFVFWQIVLVIGLAFLSWLLFRAGLEEIPRTVPYFFLGFVCAGVTGFISQQALLERDQLGPTRRARKQPRDS